MKLFASDFDNTLYFKDTFKDEDLIAIKKYQNQGHLFGVCSGNYLNRIKDYSKNYISYDFYITSSGSLIVYNDEIIYETQIPYETLQSLFQTYNETCKIWIHADFDLYVTPKSTFAISKPNIISSLNKIPTNNIHGISIGFKTSKQAREHFDQITKMYSDIEVFQNNECLDIVKKGCTKGSAINILIKQLFVEKTYGIGDNYNDLPLLKAVDVSFTFKDSPQELQDTCTYVVNSVAEAIQIILEEDNNKK